MRRLHLITAALVAALLFPLAASGAGTLTPVGSPDQPIEIRDHRVNVTINNGFARTEVNQTFFNPNPTDLEALYAFPVPESASLSEMTIWAGERELNGEVLESSEADRIYQEERDAGNDAGQARKESYQRFEFSVSPVRANDETRVRFVYYQPLEIDTGVGRYVYPLQEGGTDEFAEQFWLRNERVEGRLSVEVMLESAWPIIDIRVPAFDDQVTKETIGDDRYRITLERDAAELSRDFVLYYRLADDLPGRVELVPYRADPSRAGTFMLIVTPGLDLQPITHGADYTFILDVSGSMDSKLSSLARGVSQAIGKLQPQDRFRVVTFSDRACDVTRGYLHATPSNVSQAIASVEGLRTQGGTNLHAGLDLGLKGLDDDRATSIILVTDGVANQGIIDPKELVRLVRSFDVRIFGFVMGNSANWPLMNTISAATGGFSAGISNDDDIVGQILLAKSKITHESLHDARIRIDGVRTSQTTDGAIGKIYRGQQLVLFGRYDQGGRANVTLDAKLTGQDRTYTTTFDFPDIDTDNPEIERLWALNRVEWAERQEMLGALPTSEAQAMITDLGINYQLVTDYTSMVVLSDESFEERGIERRNRDRVAIERQSQTVRSRQPVRNHRVDQSQPLTPGRAPRLGGGAFDPISVALTLLLAGVAAGAFVRRSH